MARSIRILYAGAVYGLVWLTLSLGYCASSKSAICEVNFTAFHILGAILTAWGLVVWALGSTLLLALPTNFRRSRPNQCVAYGASAVIGTLIYTTLIEQDSVGTVPILIRILNVGTLWEFIAGACIPLALYGITRPSKNAQD